MGAPFEETVSSATANGSDNAHPWSALGGAALGEVGSRGHSGARLQDGDPGRPCAAPWGTTTTHASKGLIHFKPGKREKPLSVVASVA
jgi:hypothetical protein